MEKKMYTLRTDPEFSKIAPPLKQNERELLEKDILINGCIDPLIVWKGIIIDGHNRYEICKEHGIPFAVTEHSFNDRGDAMVWIAINQLARRNLSMFQKCEMVLPLKKQFDAEAKKRQLAGVRVSEGKGDVRNLLADIAGVSHNTMGKAIWLSSHGDSETLRRLRNGEISIHHAYTSSRVDITKNTIIAKDQHVEQDSGISGELPIENTPSAYEEPMEKNSIGDVRYLVGELIREVQQGNTDSDFIVDVLTDVIDLLK